MISGIRTAPPISTSSPRDTMASPSRANAGAPAFGWRGAAVSARVVDCVAHGSHHQTPRMGLQQGRYVGVGEDGVHRWEMSARVAHRLLVLVESPGRGLGTGISITPTPSPATPLKLIAPRTRTRYLAPGVSSR